MKKWLRKAVAGIAAAAVVFGSAGVLPEGGAEMFIVRAGAEGDVAINETNFPDDNFRAYVSMNFDNSPKDGSLSSEEIAKVVFISHLGTEITNLKGIEFFTEITKLDCDSNKLSNLDISKNTLLTYLRCDKNQLTSLDVSKNTELTYLECGYNQLTDLDVSKNTKLEKLLCYNNKLTSIDVSKNTELTSLDCLNNQITSLDVSKNTKLTSLQCTANPIKSLDVSKNTKLTALECCSNQLTSLDVSKNTELTYLVCMYNQLTSLDVSNNTALTNLNCKGNQFTSLDLSKNTALTRLECNENQLTSLDLSKNTALDRLECIENQLTSLDLSKNTKLVILICNENQLTSLDLSKNTELISLECNENQLTSLDVSGGIKLTSLYCESNQLTSLDLSKNTELSGLKCGDNKLTSLDLSKNTKLNYLACSNNHLTSLDLSKNTEFYNLVCENNTYGIGAVSDTYALSNLPGSFDPAKASNWNGATCDSSTKTLKDFTGDKATYTYNCGQGKSATFTLTLTENDTPVPEKEVKSISVTAPKSASKLYTGDDFDPTGYTIKVTYDDNSTEVIDLTAEMCSGFDSTTAGTKTITVTYEGKTTTFDVTVSEKPGIAVDTITVSTKPTKTEYTVGDAFDVTGGKLTVTYTGGKEAETIDLTAEMCSGFDSTTAGKKTITVTYEGKTATFDVTVSEKPVIDEGTVILVGENEECKTIGDAVAKINADAKAKKLGKMYTIKFSGAMTETRAISLPDTTVWLKAGTESVVTVPSITAKGSLMLENVTVKTAKGAAAAVTVKKAFTADNSAFGKTKVSGHADISDCTIDGTLTLSEKIGETKLTNVTVKGKVTAVNTLTLDNCTMGAVTSKGALTVNGGEFEAITVSAKNGTTKLNGDIKITKNLSVSNDLVIDGNSEVGGKFTAKGGISMSGTFNVKNGK